MGKIRYAPPRPRDFLHLFIEQRDNWTLIAAVFARPLRSALMPNRVGFEKNGAQPSRRQFDRLTIKGCDFGAPRELFGATRCAGFSLMAIRNTRFCEAVWHPVSCPP